MLATGPKPIEPDAVVQATGGIFDDPLWFRLLVALLAGGAGIAVLYWTAQIVRSGVLWATGVVVAGVDPLGIYLLALGGAMIAPRSCLATLYMSARRHAWLLIAIWACLIAVGLAILLVAGR
jgi:hypothetical protein